MSGRGGSEPRKRRRGSLETVSLAGMAVLLVAGVVAPAPFVVESAGPTFNTVGEYEGHQLVRIEGAKSYPSGGRLDLTTVYVAGGPSGRVNSINALLGWFDPTESVLPQDTVYPAEMTGQQVEDSNVAAMETSQEDSVAAALGHLGEPYDTTLRVHASMPGTPAEKVLKAGDVLVAVDGQTVTGLEALRAALDRAGERGVELTVRRDGRTLSRHVGLVRDEGTGRWQLGVYLIPDYDFPVTVDFQLDQVGGPSAGMMFALGIVEELTPGSMVGSQHVAGTGTITPDGTVGPIGGIRQKLEGASRAGARYFLAPRDNCDEVTAHVPDGLQVVAVATLDDAVSAVEHAAAEDVSDLPSCGTR